MSRNINSMIDSIQGDLDKLRDMVDDLETEKNSLQCKIEELEEKLSQRGGEE